MSNQTLQLIMVHQVVFQKQHGRPRPTFSRADFSVQAPIKPMQSPRKARKIRNKSRFRDSLLNCALAMVATWPETRSSLLSFFLCLGFSSLYCTRVGLLGFRVPVATLGLYRDLVYFGFMSGSGFRGLFGYSGLTVLWSWGESLGLTRLMGS